MVPLIILGAYLLVGLFTLRWTFRPLCRVWVNHDEPEGIDWVCGPIIGVATWPIIVLAIGMRKWIG